MRPVSEYSGQQLLDQFIANTSDESREGAAQLFRTHYWWLDLQESKYAKAIREIIESSPDPPTHKVVDCSGGKFNLVGEYFRQKLCKVTNES